MEGKSQTRSFLPVVSRANGLPRNLSVEKSDSKSSTWLRNRTRDTNGVRGERIGSKIHQCALPPRTGLDSIADLRPRAARQLAELRYGAYRIAPSARACQDNSSRYGGWAKKLRIHTWTRMSSQSVY